MRNESNQIILIPSGESAIYDIRFLASMMREEIGLIFIQMASDLYIITTSARGLARVRLPDNNILE